MPHAGSVKLRPPVALSRLASVVDLISQGMGRLPAGHWGKFRVILAGRLPIPRGSIPPAAHHWQRHYWPVCNCHSVVRQSVPPCVLYGTGRRQFCAASGIPGPGFAGLGYAADKLNVRMELILMIFQHLTKLAWCKNDF